MQSNRAVGWFWLITGLLVLLPLIAGAQSGAPYGGGSSDKRTRPAGVTDAEVRRAIADAPSMSHRVGAAGVSHPIAAASATPKVSEKGDIELTAAGLSEYHAQRFGEALKLFHAALMQNAFSAAANLNAAIVGLRLGRPQDVFGPVTRLTVMTPNDYRLPALLAQAYRLRYQETQGKDLRRMFEDSVAYFSDLSQNTPVRVVVTNFVRGTDRTILEGMIENRTLSEKTYFLDVEFVDKKGDAFLKRSVTVGPVKPQSSEKFKIDLPKGGAFGYRYYRL
jgi:hypothetical protein